MAALYIPSGKITTHSALDYMMRSFHNELVEAFPKLVADEKTADAIKVRARPETIKPPRRGLIDTTSREKPAQPITQEERAWMADVVRKRKHLEEICDQELKKIRRGLAESEIAAAYIKENGKEYPIDIYYWRSPFSLKSLKFGNYRRYHAMTGHTDEGTILLPRTDFESWANPSLRATDSEATQEATGSDPRRLGANSQEPTQVRARLGGRPRTYDWDAFAAEMIRLANMPDGLPDQTDLVRIMTEWCLVSWGKEPADSMIRDRVSKLYSPST